MKKIVAVVVTYNRIALLQECVAALQNQQTDDEESIQFDALIVDNASTDGTVEWIRQRTTQKFGTGTVYSLCLSENSGGAGGFYAGMKWAMEQGYDAIWIMDDDTIPQPDALAQLLRGMNAAAQAKTGQKQGETVGFVSSTVLWTDGTPCRMNRQHEIPTTAEESLPQGICPVDSATFVSLLFSREAVARMGLPLKDYFIWGDDKEYTLRISGVFPCYHVKDSVVIHKMATNAGSNIVMDEMSRVPRYYYAYRNDLCTARRRGAKEVLVYLAAFALNVCRVLLRSRDGKKERVATMWHGLKDGIAFSPEVEYASTITQYSNLENM